MPSGSRSSNLMGRASNLLSGERAQDFSHLARAPLASGSGGSAGQRRAIAAQMGTTSSPNLNARVQTQFATPKITNPSPAAAVPPPAAKSTETVPPAPTLKGYQAPVSEPYAGGSLKL